MRAVSLAFILTLLGGCAGLLAPQHYSDAEFAALLSKHRFAAAQSYVDRLQTAGTTSQRARLLAEQLRSAQSAYRKEVIERARAAQDGGHWRDAADQWRAGLSMLPDDAALEQGQARFATERRRRLEGLEYQFAELRADNLARKIAMTQELADVAEKPATWHRMQAHYQQEARSIVPLLERRAYAAEKNGDWERAGDEYRRLLSLAPDPEFRDALKRVDRHITEQEHSARQARQKRERAHYRELAEQFRKALAADDLQTAQQLLDKMRREDADDEDVSADARQLADRIERRVNTLAERGRNEYTRGNLGAAISAWTQALQLEPGNTDLKNRIERAQRFRQNVERLSH